MSWSPYCSVHVSRWNIISSLWLIMSVFWASGLEGSVLGYPACTQLSWWWPGWRPSSHGPCWTTLRCSPPSRQLVWPLPWLLLEIYCVRQAFMLHVWYPISVNLGVGLHPELWGQRLDNLSLQGGSLQQHPLSPFLSGRSVKEGSLGCGWFGRRSCPRPYVDEGKISKISLPRLGLKDAASIPDETVRGPSVLLPPLWNDILEA